MAKKQKSALDYALWMLSRRAHSVQEVADKLRSREHLEPEIAAVMQKLTEAGYLDDKRFAEYRVRYRAETSGWGKQRIIQDLREKGVAADIISHAIENWQQNRSEELSFNRKVGYVNELAPNAPDEKPFEERATTLLMKKFGAWPSDLPMHPDSNLDWEERQDVMKQIDKEKSRRLSFLLRRGFGMDEARKALEESLRASAC